MKIFQSNPAFQERELLTRWLTNIDEPDGEFASVAKLCFDIAFRTREKINYKFHGFIAFT